MEESRLPKSKKPPSFVIHIPELWAAQEDNKPTSGELEVNIQVLVNGVLWQVKDKLQGKITGRDGYSKEYTLERVS